MIKNKDFMCVCTVGLITETLKCGVIYFYYFCILLTATQLMYNMCICSKYSFTFNNLSLIYGFLLF